MSDIRKPPLHPYRKGFCSWCNEAIEPRLKKDGTPHAIQGAFHSKCGAMYRNAFNVSGWLDVIGERDGYKCASCGESFPGWHPCFGTKHDAGTTYEYETKLIYTPIRAAWLYHVDHVQPLWKAAGIEDITKRQGFFKPENCQLLCAGPRTNDCHGHKTREEAAERAKVKRLEEKRQPKKPLPEWY